MKKNKQTSTEIADTLVQDLKALVKPNCPHAVEKNSSGWWCNEQHIYVSVLHCYHCKHKHNSTQKPKKKDLRSFFA